MISTNDLLKLKLLAQDGDIGSVRDLVFHDTDWAIRELIADTGGWLVGRRVSLDPGDVLEPDVAAGVLPLELTRDQVKNGPSGPLQSPSAGPVSDEILAWTTSNAPAWGPETMLLGGASGSVHPLETQTPPAGLHVRSLRELEGYVVLARDEQVGKLAGFLVDPVAWDLPIALVQLDGAEGALVLLPTRLIAGLGWPEHVACTYLAPATLRDAPVYDPQVQDERGYLPAVADYYTARV